MTQIIRAIPFGQTKPRDIHIQNGRITKVTAPSTAKPDFGSPTAQLTPALCDIQVNGGWGIDLQSPNLRPEDIATLSDRLAAWGVARWVPTIITNAQNNMERACSILAEACQDRALKKRIPGSHIEGPYISPEDGPRGAHAKKHVRPPSLREFDRLLKAAEGRILYTTLAPEIPGAIPFIRGCINRGVKVSLGHHNATPDQIHRAADAGATLSTHLGNGLASTIHRHNNPLWPQLAEDRLTASLIADGHHLPPDILKAIVRAKGASRIILTSDATHLAGLKPGHYDLAGIPVELKPNQRICLTGTDLLAGSANMLLQGVQNAIQSTGLSPQQAFAAASTNPAKALQIRYTPYNVEIDKPPTFILTNPEKYSIPIATFLNGKQFLI